MPVLKDLAAVLRVFEQGNSSQVAVFLGRKLGQVRVHVKGGRRWTKRGFPGGFDLLTRGELLVYPARGDRLWPFKEWDERARPLRLLPNPDRASTPPSGRKNNVAPADLLSAASYMCELVEALTRPGAGTAVFTSRPSAGKTKSLPPENSDAADLYEKLFELLSAYGDLLPRTPKPGILLPAFTLEVLSAAGTIPDPSVCLFCGAVGRAMFFSHAGAVCAACLAAAAKEYLRSDAWPEGVPPPTNHTALLRLGTVCFAEGRLPGNGALRKPSASNDRKNSGAFSLIPSEPGWLPPEALVASNYVRRTKRPVQLSRRAARALAALLKPLLFVGLGHDLRTAAAAAALVRKSAERSTVSAAAAPARIKHLPERNKRS